MNKIFLKMLILLICIILQIEYIYADIKKIPVVDAFSAITLDSRSERILYEKNIHKRCAIASTTKIMTAIVAIENGNLEDIVTVSKRAASIWGSTIELRCSEKIKLHDLLYGLLLKSGNDAAIAIAEHVGGSVENFVNLMNEKAADLGLKDTNFVTPHGLDKDAHFSTAYDLAQITKYALQNKVFSKIVATTNININTRSFYNTNDLLITYPGANGVKTGYTGKAGRCLVTSVVRGDWKIISVVLNCPTRERRTRDSRIILDYTFNNYKPYKLVDNNNAFGVLPVCKGKKKDVKIFSCESIVIPLLNEEISRIDKKIFLPKELNAPVSSNVEVGKIEFLIDNKIIASSGLKVIEEINKKQFIDYLEQIIYEWVKQPLLLIK